MMTICDVKSAYFFKCFFKEIRGLLWTFPKNVLHIPIPIVARNITIWFFVLNDFVHLRFDSFFVILERQEHWAYVCLLYLCKFCSVIFFLWQCELMPFNFVTLVILDARKSYNTLLNMTIHDLSIDV